jgi:hypothetical protein
MNVNLYVIEDYENEPPSGPKKQTQNKPNFFKGQNRLPENLATPSNPADKKNTLPCGT